MSFGTLQTNGRGTFGLVVCFGALAFAVGAVGLKQWQDRNALRNAFAQGSGSIILGSTAYTLQLRQYGQNCRVVAIDNRGSIVNDASVPCP